MAISNTKRNVFFSIIGIAAAVTGAAIISVLVGNILNHTGHATALTSGLETYGKWATLGGAGSLCLTLCGGGIVYFHAVRKNKPQQPLDTDQ